MRKKSSVRESTVKKLNDYLVKSKIEEIFESLPVRTGLKICLKTLFLTNNDNEIVVNNFPRANTKKARFPATIP